MASPGDASFRSGVPHEPASVHPRKWLVSLSLAVAITLVFLAGFFVYKSLAGPVEVMPLYELSWPSSPLSRRSFVVGPWLLITTSNPAPASPSVEVEARLVVDGTLVARHSLTDVGLPISYNACLDHPELGANTVLGRINTGDGERLFLFQPLTGASKVVAEWKFNELLTIDLDNDGAYLLEKRMLPLSPLTLLGTGGLPETLALAFQMDLDDHAKGLHAVPLVRVRDTRTGRLLCEYSLRDSSGCSVHICFSESSRLLECRTPASDRLGDYFHFVGKRPVPQGSSLRSLMAGVTLRDTSSGVRLWSDASMRCYWSFSCRGTVILTSYDDSQHAWPYSKQNTTFQIKKWLFQPDVPCLTELEVADAGDVPSFASIGPNGLIRFIFWNLHSREDKNEGELRWTDFDRSGKLQGYTSVTIPPTTSATYFATTNLVAMQDESDRGKSETPKQEGVWNWLKQWTSDTLVSLQVLDAESGQKYSFKHSVLTKREEAFISPNGHLLMVEQFDENNYLQTLDAYRLPLPPAARWKAWIAAICAVLLGMCVLTMLRLCLRWLHRRG